MRLVCIDVGTNSVISLIAQRGKDRLRTFKFGFVTSQLGRFIYKRGEIGKTLQGRTLRIIRGVIEDSFSYCPEGFSIVGTHALRIAKDAEEFCKKVFIQTGLRVHIISPQEEIELIYCATRNSLKPPSPFLIIDIGGGSTEVVYADENGIRVSYSIPIGAMGVREVYKHNRQESISYIREKLKKITLPGDVERCAGIGGTVTTLALLVKGYKAFYEEKIHKKVIHKSSVESITDFLWTLRVAQIKKLIPFDPNRARILPAGALILNILMDYLRIDRLYINTKGLVYGLAYVYPRYDSMGEPKL